ncbi:YcxB family protein [Consotaella aegiceratis]|uniref:YcxB family protein n=1 Tax=Consotaella aegiceratis TaxID=3097961 RepID=UPI002F3E68A5
MRFTYRLTVEDYAALINARGLRRHFGQPSRWLWYGLGVADLALLIAAIVVVDQSAGLWIVITLSAGAALAFSAPSLYWLYVKRAFRRQRLGDADVTLELTETSVRIEGGGIETQLNDGSITKVDDRRNHILLWVNDMQAVILPKRALGARMSAGQFIDAVEGGRRAGA